MVVFLSEIFMKIFVQTQIYFSFLQYGHNKFKIKIHHDAIVYLILYILYTT